MDLEKLVVELNDTDLQPKDIEKITELINEDDQDALMIACKFGYLEAVDKLTKEIVVEKESSTLKKGSLQMEAQIGGPSISSIYAKPKRDHEKIKEVKRFDYLKKDKFGKSAFSYALEDKSKNTLALFYKNCDITTFPIKAEESIRYFVDELERCYTYNPNNAHGLLVILDILTENQNLIENINAETFRKYCSIAMDFGIDSNLGYSRILKKMCEGISQDCLDESLDFSIPKDEYDYYGVNLQRSNLIECFQRNSLYLQKVLLKYGAKITNEQIQRMYRYVNSVKNDNSTSVQYELNEVHKELKSIFEDIYIIDPNDFSTIVGKSKSVIEHYFGKSIDEVFSYYITNDQVDFYTVHNALNCFYDLKDKESRIEQISRLGGRLLNYSSKNKSFFSNLNEDQINSMLKSGCEKLSDIDIKEILNRTFLNISEYDFFNICHIIASHDYKDDLTEYQNLIFNSPLCEAYNERFSGRLRIEQHAEKNIWENSAYSGKQRK